MLGIDLGTNAAMSAASAYFKSGELEAVACFPELPSLAERGLGDGVGDLYQRMARRGELFQAGRRVSDVPALLREVLDRWGRPVAVVCDRWRVAELRQALEGAAFPVAAMVERGMGFRDGGQDVRDFRAAVLGDRVRPSQSLLLRSALAEAREATRRWLGLVDRMPAAELVDLILCESAYAFELRGPRFHQARENLKKIRSLMRRIQNRGYGTLARMAAHLDRLAVGDEANAAIDALDAVNLMTVHASKGLEFPVVFVVNLAQGSGSRREPVRLTADPSGEGDSVAVGDFQSEADGDHAAREREETKRLLYVALTRARDRLYLGTALKDGRILPARGSLAEVLPASFRERFAAAAEGIEWRASSGRVHRFRACSPAGSLDTHGEGRTLTPSDHIEDRSSDDFTPLDDDVPAPRTAAAAVAEARGLSGEALAAEPSQADRVVGTLVHRLLQRCGFDMAGDTKEMRETALRVLQPEEVAEASGEGTAAELADSAVDIYRAICSRPDIRALYMAGDRLHELPFTMRLDGVVIRGVIDCLIRTAPGRMTLLEFKTGRPHDDHRVQLGFYRQAAERLFPGVTIDARLVYPGGSTSSPEGTTRE